jgi:hypothetical protein
MAKGRHIWKGLAALVVASATGRLRVKTGAPVPGPPESRWRRARVDVERRGGHLVGGRWERGWTSLVLVLEDGEQVWRCSVGSGESTPRAMLRFAPDGHALALSLNRGETWFYVGLDVGDGALVCHHVELATAELWSGVPETRALVLEILASSDERWMEGRCHARPSTGFPHHMPRVDAEYWTALEYALARPEDPALRRAVLEALLLPGKQLEQKMVDFAMPGIVEMAHQHADLREALLEAAPGPHYERLLAMLGALATAAAQARLLAFVAELSAPPGEAAADCRFEQAVYALVASVLERRDAPEGTPALLAAIAGSNRPLPPGLQYSHERKHAIERRFTVQRLAVLALAALDAPAARAALATLAEGPCVESVVERDVDVVRDRPPRPVWPERLLPLGDEKQKDWATHFTSACWAGLALATPPPLPVLPPEPPALRTGSPAARRSSHLR